MQNDKIKTFHWFILYRLLFLLGLLSIFSLLVVLKESFLTPSQIPIGFLLLAISFFSNFLFSFQSLEVPNYQPWVQLFLDTFFISLWIYTLNDSESWFALVYLIQILVASLIFFKRGAYFSSAVCTLLYAVVTLSKSRDLPTALLQVLIFALVFIGVGAIGGFLSEELSRTTQKLGEKQKKIEALSLLHEKILEELPLGLLTIDSNQNINFINSIAGEIFENQNLVGKKLVDFGVPFSDLLRESGKEKLLKVQVGNKHKILRAEISAFVAERDLTPIFASETTEAHILTFQDVTALIELEKKLKQNEKLAAVGQLAAGIAHEIRNPLAGISGSIELLKTSLLSKTMEAEEKKLIEIALKEIDRLNSLITEFLDYVKPTQLDLKPHSLAILLEDVIFSIEKSRPSKLDVKIQRNLDAAVLAKVEDRKIRQVMWNLILNSFQAMASAGSIEVGCGWKSEKTPFFWVEDQGVGMDDKAMEHLFEPFFTTKEKGTGLGLAICYKIVEGHQGEIKVSSKRNVGTRVEVILRG